MPGIEEDLLRDLLLEEVIDLRSNPGYESITQRVKDVKLLRSKVRGTLTSDGLDLSTDWIPSRTLSVVEKVEGDELGSTALEDRGPSIGIGETSGGYPVKIPVSSLDGSLTLILGKKGSGKSHLAKLMVNGLADNGAYVLAFDINNEYIGLVRNKDGSPSRLARKIVLLEPGTTLKFDLRYMGKGVISSVFRNALGLPSVSLRELIRIWNYLEGYGHLSFSSLGDYITRWRTNEMIREALLSRYYTLASTGMIMDSDDGGFSFEDTVAELKEGGIMVVLLAGISPVARRIVVEAMLSKLLELLHSRSIPPMFILAEEAHMYIRETYWEDLVTRMRHYGAFTIFVTNQPDALEDLIYRQADNFFLFGYTNKKDIDLISRLSATDAETLEGVIPTLRRGSCLVIGKATNWLPVVVNVKDTEFESLGRTRLFFQGIRLKSNNQ